jgi:hypothetical protein
VISCVLALAGARAAARGRVPAEGVARIAHAMASLVFSAAIPRRACCLAAWTRLASTLVAVLRNFEGDRMAGVGIIEP